MRPRNEIARDQLETVLGRHSPASAADLAATLDVSIPTLHRLLRERPEVVVATGKARRARYAWRRPLRGDVASLPVYEIDASGRAELLAPLSLVRPRGSCLQLEGTGWPVPEESRDGWWPGLPYPLYDMCPQGYMGRQFARAVHLQLAVSPNPRDWADDDIAYVLSREGVDMSGNLILGDPAFERWQGEKVGAAEPLPSRALGAAYSRLAEQALRAGVAGSSAGGEFPKFTARRVRIGSATPHVLVKFSGADLSAAVRRWSDLLVSEHLALECAATLPGVAAASSRILTHAGRTFLEVERFDRHGPFGRSRLISLSTLNAALIGEGSSDWTVVAARLQAEKLLHPDEVRRIERLWWFGRLIANTDMHAGNLSFIPHVRPNETATLAPAYDMLPMHYAPLPGGEVPSRNFDPPLPRPAQRSVWIEACQAATKFWDCAAIDGRISVPFRRVCAANSARLTTVVGRL